MPSDSPACTIAAILLAGGQSRRFGGAKLTAPLAGRPLGLHAAERLRALDLPVSIVQGDRDASLPLPLTVSGFGTATARMLGRDPASLRGHTLADLLAHEDRAAFIARHFTRNAQRGQSVPDLFRALHQDGSSRWVEARVARLPSGNGLGDYLVTLRDADQRRRFEESLDKANNELKELAGRKGVVVPAALKPKYQKVVDSLSKLSGAEFDKQYMSEMVKDHEKDVAAFQKESTAGKDPELTTWVKQTLPTLQGHLTMARDAETKVKKGAGKAG